MIKDELIDEMKNRISMALKDPILQQGFEIICKENAELKAGIAKLRYCCTCKKWKECKVVSMYGICADWEIKE